MMSPIKTPQHDTVRVKDFGQTLKFPCFSHPVFNPDGLPVEKSERQIQIERECRELNEKYRYKYKERVRNDSMKRAKDKAVHFHGLCSGKLTLTDSGKQTKEGHVIFNCDSWSYGFSAIMEIYGIKEQVVSYVMKYITKDCQKIFGKYYLSGGKDLCREVPTSYQNMDFDAFQGERYSIASTSDFVKYRTDLSTMAK